MKERRRKAGRQEGRKAERGAEEQRILLHCPF